MKELCIRGIQDTGKFYTRYQESTDIGIASGSENRKCDGKCVKKMSIWEVNSRNELMWRKGKIYGK